MGWDGMGWDGMGWAGHGRAGQGRAGQQLERRTGIGSVRSRGSSGMRTQGLQAAPPAGHLQAAHIEQGMVPSGGAVHLWSLRIPSVFVPMRACATC